MELEAHNLFRRRTTQKYCRLSLVNTFLGELEAEAEKYGIGTMGPPNLNACATLCKSVNTIVGPMFRAAPFDFNRTCFADMDDMKFLRTWIRSFTRKPRLTA